MVKGLDPRTLSGRSLSEWCETDRVDLGQHGWWEFPRWAVVETSLRNVLPAQCKRLVRIQETPLCEALDCMAFRSPWEGVPVQLVLVMVLEAVWREGPHGPGWEDRFSTLLQECLQWTAAELEAELVLAGLGR